MDNLLKNEIKKISKQIVLLSNEMEKNDKIIKDLNSKISIFNIMNNISSRITKTGVCFMVAFSILKNYGALIGTTFMILSSEKIELLSYEELKNNIFYENMISGAISGLYFSIPINIYNMYDIIYSNIKTRKEIKKLEYNKENFKNQKNELENKKKILIIKREKFKKEIENKDEKKCAKNIQEFDLFFKCKMEELKLENERQNLIKKYKKQSL